MIGRCDAEERVSILLENVVSLVHLPARSLSLAYSYTRDFLTAVMRALRLAMRRDGMVRRSARIHNFTESELRALLLALAPCSQPAPLLASHAAPLDREGRCAGSARKSRGLAEKYHLAECTR